MVLREKLKHHREQHSDPADWHRDPMAHYIFPMIKKEEFGK
jgi:hypothetical protein